MFVVPWGDLTYVGTTDTDYDGPLDDPQCTPADVDYLLAAMNGVLDEPVTEDDVVGTWAGLRPLLRTASSARTADLSRRHGVRVSAERRRHDHRRQAHDLPAHGRRHGRRGPATARDRAHALAGRSTCRCSGARASRPRRRARAEPARAPRRPLRHRGDAVLALVDGDPSLGEPLVPGLPYLRAEAVYAVRHEMARHARRRALTPDPGPAPGPRRVGAAAADGRRGCSHPSSAGTTRRSSARSASYRSARRGRAGRVAHGGPGSRLTGPMPDVPDA